MRFVLYVDQYMNDEHLKIYEESIVKRFTSIGFLRNDDVLVVVSRPGYITEIVLVAGE